MFAAIGHELIPKRLGNSKIRKFERYSFAYTFSRLTDKKFRKQTALSKRGFNFLLHTIQKTLSKKVS